MIAIVRLAITMALLVVLTPRFGMVGPANRAVAGYMVAIVLNGIALRPR